MPSKMQIGEVAALFDVTTKTLRHYEKLGLLEPERADNDYRLYGPEDVLRIQRIRQLQSLGLSLKEIGDLLGRDDEMLWEGVLRSLQNDVTAEIALLRERLEQIEQLLAEGVPPDEGSLPAPPDKVNDYLEQHLPQANLAAWRRDRRIVANLRAVMDVPFRGNGHGPFSNGSENGHPFPLDPGRQLMAPSTMGESVAAGFDGEPLLRGWGNGYPPTANQRAVLRMLRTLGRLQEREEEDR